MVTDSNCCEDTHRMEETVNRKRETGGVSAPSAKRGSGRGHVAGVLLFQTGRLNKVNRREENENLLFSQRERTKCFTRLKY